MGSLLSRLVPWGLAAVIAALFLTWVVSPQGPGEELRELTRLGQLSEREFQAERRAGRRREAEERVGKAPAAAPEVEAPGQAPSRVRARLARTLSSAWDLTRATLPLVCLPLGALALLRLRARATRRIRRLWIMPGRTDEASPYKVRRLLETWHQQLLRRWWRRLLHGQPPLALELHGWPDPAGVEVRLSLVCPDEPGLLEALEGSLRACYPDARLEAGAEAPRWTQAIVRLKKRHGLDRALDVPERYEDSLTDALASLVQGAGEPTSVQYVLTPAPGLVERLVRSAFRGQEREHERARLREEGDPGLHSEVVERELRGSAEGVQHRPLFFGELRVAANHMATARLVAGALQGESNAENRLVPRETRLRRTLYARRLVRGLGNPLPAVRRGVYSSAELAGLWQLPSFHLQGVRVHRSAVPRVAAPPGVLRPPRAEAILRDELGPVAIRPDDKPLGTMLLGLPGTGKSSLLAASVLADLRDENCALIVLDAKNEFARAALSVVPEDFPRGVHFLDFWHPLEGYNPFAAEVERDALADSIIESVKAIHLEGSIQASSERYLKLAVLAVMGWAEKTKPAGGPTFQDMAEILSPRGVAFRKRVVAAIESNPELHEAHRFFAEELPADLAGSLAQMTIRLDAPKNKLAQLTGTPSLDTLLRHPVSVDLDDVIRRREVLIVAGSVGEFGEGTAQALMHLLLHGVHRAVSRQRELPERQRARVALKVDEAHYLFSPTYSRMLAMDRSAGLELMSAWQSMAQIEEAPLRQQLLDLHRHKLVFATGTEDADLMAEVMQPARSNQIRDDGVARARMRIPSDAMSNMPNHFAAVSLVDRGARLASFVGETFPMRTSDARVEFHLEAMRRRGAHYPGLLPRPEREEGAADVEDLPQQAASEATQAGAGSAKGARSRPKRSRAVGSDGMTSEPTPSAPTSRRSSRADNGNGASPTQAPPTARWADSQAAERNGDRPDTTSASTPAPPEVEQGADGVGEGAPVDVPEWRPAEESSFDASGDRDAVAPLGSDLEGPVPDSYTELIDFDEPTGLKWDETPPDAPDKAPRPRPDQLEILAALYELRYLLASQIRRRWLPDRSMDTARARLTQMFHAGWVRRFKITTRKRGKTQWIYVLSERGFKLAQGHLGPRGPYIDPELRWRNPELRDAALVLHDLHAAASLFAVEATAGPFVRSWRGARTSQVDPPMTRDRGGPWRKKTVDEVSPGAGQRVRDLQLEEFWAVKPDAALELRLLGREGQARRVDLMLEQDRTRRASANVGKFQRYDAFITGWALALDRYRALGEPPIALFVCEDAEKAWQFARAADGVVTGRIARRGRPEHEWNHLGRKRMFFCVERDLHQGSLRCLKMPEWPPELRRQVELRHGRKPPERRELEFTQVGLLGGDELVRKAKVLLGT